MADYFETVSEISECDGEDRLFLLRYEVSGTYDEEAEGTPDYYIPRACISIREVSESEAELLEDDESLDRETIGSPVCAIKGMLIMSGFMKNDGYDPHNLCSAHSQAAGFCWSALTDPGSGVIIEDQSNIFFADSLDIAPAFRPENDGSGIIVTLLSSFLQFIDENVFDEELMADRKRKKRIAKGGTCAIDMIAFYPASASDLLEAAGWSRCGNSGIQYLEFCAD